MDGLAPKIAQLESKGDIPGLIKALKNKNHTERAAAASSLGAIGDRQAVEPLCSILTDANSGVRYNTARALGRIGDPRAVEALCRSLTDADSNVRGAAVEALGKIGDVRAVDPLCAARESSANIFIRPAILLALARVGDGRAVPSLCAALKESDWHIPVAAAFALARIGDPRAVEPLCAALQDPRTTVFVAAALSLARIGDACAIEYLCRSLKKESADFLLRRISAAAIGRIGGAQAVDSLLAALEDRRPEVAASAAEALARFGETRAMEPLCAALKDRNVDMRQGAAESIGMIGDDRAVVPLGNAVHLNRPDNDYQYYDELRAGAAAVRSMGRIGGQAAAAALENLLESSKWEVAGAQWRLFVAAAEALARLGNPRAVEVLTKALANSDWEIRLAAAEALAGIGAKPVTDIKKTFAEAAGCGIHAIDDIWQQALATATAYGKGQAVPETDDKWERLLAVVEAFAKIGDPRAVEMLRSILSLQHLPPNLHEAAGEVLCRIGDPHAIEVLLTAFPSFSSNHYVHSIYQLAAAVMLKECDALNPPSNASERPGESKVAIQNTGESPMEIIQSPVFQLSQGRWTGPDQALVEKVKKENDSALSWFSAQAFPPIPAWGGEGVAANYCFDMARQAQDSGNVREAWAGFHQALRRFCDMGDEKMAGSTCFHLGKVYGVQENWEMARLMFLQSAYWTSLVGDQTGYAWSLFYLGDTSERLGDRPIAKQVLSIALPIFQKVSPADVPGIEKALHRISGN